MNKYINIYMYFILYLYLNIYIFITFPNLTLFINDLPPVSVLFLTQFLHGKFSSSSFFIY